MNQQPDPLQGLGVIVVNFGSHEIVEANLCRSLGDQFPGQVIVVDNFSSAHEREAIEVVCSRHGWSLVPVPTNEGFGGGNNRGAALAISRGATELLMLNPDAWLDLETLGRLLEQVQADRQLQLAPVVLRPDGSLFSAEVDLHLHRGEMLATRKRAPDADLSRIHTWVSGACFVVSVDLWKRLDGFDENYFLYWEDVDLSRRVVQLGGSVRVDPQLSAVHDEGTTHRATGEQRAKSPIYYYYNCRNRLLYAAKFLSRRAGIRWVMSTPRVSYRILLQGGKRQLINPRRNLWPALRGSFDGIRLWRSSAASDK